LFLKFEFCPLDFTGLKNVAGLDVFFWFGLKKVFDDKRINCKTIVLEDQENEI